MIKDCLYCGKEFKTTKHHHVVYCSHLCANNATAKRRQRRTIIICQYCGNNFEVTNGDLKYRGVVKYCSRECFNNANKVKDIKCKSCGIKFKPKRKSQSFCSVKCVNKCRAGSKLSTEAINKVKEAMAKPEVKKKLSKLNSRKRKPMTYKHKAKISNSLVGKMPSNIDSHNHYKHIRSGKYKIGDKVIFFRSRWEANYALYLDFLIKQKQILSWEYEGEVFIFDKIQFGTRSYRPDFKVVKNDNKIEYHEVKGQMDKKSKTKLKRMEKYYPEVTIKLIDAKVYRSLQKWSKLLKFYEGNGS